jgi:hypothetical protein
MLSLEYKTYQSGESVDHNRFVSQASHLFKEGVPVYG